MKNLIIIILIFVCSCNTESPAYHKFSNTNPASPKIGIDMYAQAKKSSFFKNISSSKLFLMYSLANIEKHNKRNIYNAKLKKKILQNDSNSEIVNIFFTSKYPFIECDFEFAEFIKINDSCFISNSAVHYPAKNLSQIIKITADFSYDSIIVSDRYRNMWGFKYSDTEGFFVIDTSQNIYDSSYCINKNDSAFDYNNLIYNSLWHKIEKTDSCSYTLKHYGNIRNFWENNSPPMTAEQVKEFDKNKLGPRFWPQRKWEPVLTGFEFKFSIYQKNVYRNIYLYIKVHYGEC